MQIFRFINGSIHGILDYIVDAVLIGVPLALDFGSVSTLALYLPLGIGVANFSYSLLTRYSRGLVNLISFRLHLALDFAVGILLLAAGVATGLFGIAGIFLATMGAGIMIVVVCTDPDRT